MLDPTPVINFLESMDMGEPVIIDCETISYDDKAKAVDCFHGHRVSCYLIKQLGKPGIAIPVRHRSKLEAFRMYDIEEIRGHLVEWATKVKIYINANPKFDLRFMAESDGVLLSYPGLECYDTQVMARLVKNDLMSVSLSNLCNFFNLTKKLDIAQKWCQQNNTGDYGRIPVDILVEYGLGDLDSTEELYFYLYKIIYGRSKV